MICAAREALAEIVEEGLENRWERHKNTAETFWKGIEKLKMKCFVPNPEYRLWTVNMIILPPDIKWPVLLDYAQTK